MVSAVSAIANDGMKMKPRIVKKIIDTKTGEIQEIQAEKTEQIISEKTAKEVLSMMQSVVAEGTGKNATVKGFTVGGKTGTSEDGVNTNKYVTSFIGVAPITDPQVVILVTLYNPTGEGGHQGGAWVILTTHSETMKNREWYKLLNQEWERFYRSLIMSKRVKTWDKLLL